MIGLIDYEMGNLRSVETAFKRCGCYLKRVNNPDELKKCDKVVLPGVGAFKDGIKNLKTKNLDDGILDWIKTGKPMLGICLGLQLLFEESEEFGTHNGLGILKGKVKRFEEKCGFKVPHMGWNSIKIERDLRIFKGINDGEYFYFVHSYYVVPQEKTIIASTTEYNTLFCSSIESANIVATQFHPEKSQFYGLRFIDNFIKLY